METFEDLLKKLDKDLSERAAREAPYIAALVEKLNISEEKANKLDFNADNLPYTPQEFALVVEYFVQEFNGFDKLCTFIKEQSMIDTMYDVSFRKNTIFTLKPYTQFGARIKFLQDFFEIDRDECISLITQNPSWIYHKEQYFIERLEPFANLFNLTKSQTVSFFKEYPFTLGKRINNLSANIDEIAEYYDINASKVKSLLLDYPGLMNRTLGYFLEFKVPIEVFDKHWLISCMTKQNDFSAFAGYRTFENLIIVLKKIEESIGEIIDFYKRDYSDGSSFALLIRNNDRKFLVTLGSNTVSKAQIVRLLEKTPEEKVLESIFGADYSKKKPHEEHFYHREYLCELKDGSPEQIDDILRLLSAISFHNATKEITLKDGANIFYLSDSDDISRCSIDILENIEYSPNNLNVCFYKVEPKGNGKINITSLRKPLSQEEIDALFSDLNNDEDDSVSLFDDDDDFDSLFGDDEDDLWDLDEE